ncbi:EcsC family protein [Desulfotomaculum sp. 1211_IL3151]|uniref:EcsC family protein n=1 Tax=Desulfotomaculum sp. 1211_IL3151 TaxID=3084055 RepID=UPI002FDA2D7F
MENYEKRARLELSNWQAKMIKRPSLFNNLTKGMQNRVNQLIPERVHQAMTTAIKNLLRATLIGSEYTTQKPVSLNLTLEEREKQVQSRLIFYRKAAAWEGAGTGAGGLLLGLADFPLLLSLKMKFLFEVAALYGYNVRDYRERLYILHLFQLAFASDKGRREIYQKIYHWQSTVQKFPPDLPLQSIDWRQLQQEYRDYIDLVKLLQLLPGIGAVVGAYGNYRLLDTLGETAINGYRLRYFNK